MLFSPKFAKVAGESREVVWRWGSGGARRGLGGGGRVPGRKWSRNAAGRDFDSGRWGDQAARNLLGVDRDQALI